jgi:hypothetical protein
MKNIFFNFFLLALQIKFFVLSLLQIVTIRRTVKMNRFFSKIVFRLCVVSCLGCFADSATSLDEDTESRHHVYFGPEFLCYQLDRHIQSVHVHGTRFFWGFRYGYEYRQLNMIYAAIDFMGIRNDIDFQASRGKPMSWHRADRGFGNIEARLGYTAVLEDWKMVPYLSVGYYGVYELDHHNTQGFSESLPYIAGGMRSEYITRDRWTMGCNWKILRTYSSQQKFKYKGGEAVDRENLWGAELGFPVTWYIDAEKKWDMKVEPYFLTFGFPGKQTIYGLHWTFARNF